MFLNVVLIIMVIVLFVAFLYAVVRKPKHQGTMEVLIDEMGMITYSLEVTENPDGFRYMDYVTFKVVQADIAE